MHSLVRKLRGLVYSAVCRLATGGRIDPKKVVFNQTDGNGYGCNQKYIAAEILRRKLDWDLVWLCRDPAKARAEMPDGIRVVPFFSFAAMKELTTARIWCSNQFFRHHVKHCGLKKRQGQTYFQTWHGSMGIKVVHSGASWELKCPQSAGNAFKRLEAGFIDYVIANSGWDAAQQLDFYYGHGEVKMLGHPRNDMFFDPRLVADMALKVRREYGLEPDVKIVLYVPTLRLNKNWNGYIRDFTAIEKAFEARFGGRWKAVARMHPVLLHKGKKLDGGTGAVDASTYADIQELLAAADAMISDYSSCMFDYMLLKRPCFAFVPDLEPYEKEQGLVYPITETPFPVSKTLDGLADSIASFPETGYDSAIDAFLKGKGCCEDGRAAARVVDMMVECVEGR